jgi:MFS family permease
MAGLGVSAAASGPLLGPIVIGGLSANLLASARLDSWGPAPFLGCGVGLMALGNLVTAFLGTHVAGFELGTLLLGAGVSSMSSGALRYLATLYGTSHDIEANQAAVSLLTNVGVLLGGSVWGAFVASSAAPVAVIRLGLLAMTVALVPPAAALVFVPVKLPERKGARVVRAEH